MAGRISALESQKRSRDRVNVYLEGEFAFGLAGSAAANLKIGTWLSDEAIAELTSVDGLERAHSRALDYLSYRPRSEAELRDYLLKKEYPEGAVEEVLARLKRVGLVDDAEFARYWIDNRARFRPRGVRTLRYELQQKGVASETIEEALDDYDELAAVRKVAQEQARRLQHLRSDKIRRRLYARLARRGFSSGLIQEILAAEDFPQLIDDNSEED